MPRSARFGSSCGWPTPPILRLLTRRSPLKNYTISKPGFPHGPTQQHHLEHPQRTTSVVAVVGVSLFGLWLVDDRALAADVYGQRAWILHAGDGLDWHDSYFR